MKLITARQTDRDIRGLQPSAFSWRVSRKVARDRDKDMPLRFRVDPFVDLTHASFKYLIGVKTRVFTQ